MSGAVDDAVSELEYDAALGRYTGPRVTVP